MFDLLIVDDTPAVRKQLARTFSEQLSGYRVHQAADKANGLRMLQAVSPDLVLLDLVMPSAAGGRDAKWTAGRELLAAIRQGWPAARVVVLTSEEGRTRQFLVEEGADDFFTKSDLRGAGLLKLIGIVEELIGHFPCRSEGSLAAWGALQSLGAAERLVLLCGEPGVGKRSLARWVAAHGSPPDSPGTELDCLRDLSGTIVEPSPLECAHPRAVVVTGVEQASALSQETQAALAGLLARAGARQPVVCVSRSPRDGLLAAAGLSPALRELLAEAPAIELPPLRDRGADLVELAGICCRRHARLLGKTARGLDEDAAEALAAYHEETPWRRNLAELDELVAGAVARASGELLAYDDLRLESPTGGKTASCYTVLSLDVVGSTELKRGQVQETIEATFAALHHWIEELALRHRGEVYSQSGDGVLLRFPVADDAFQCACVLLSGLGELNREANALAAEIAVRIGLHTGDLPPAPRAARGRVASPTLDLAAKLQESARPGEVLLSAAVYACLTDTSALRPLRAPLAGVQVYSC